MGKNVWKICGRKYVVKNMSGVENLCEKYMVQNMWLKICGAKYVVKNMLENMCENMCWKYVVKNMC